MKEQPLSRSESEAKKPDRHWLWAFNDWYSKVGAVPVQLSDAFLAGMTAARSERGLSREPTEVMVQSVRGIKIQPEMVRVIWRSMWDAAQSNERD